MNKISLAKISLLSFIVVIIAGTFLLSLPICNNGSSASILDNLFTATSSTCVTGLVTVCVAQQYNLLGQLIVLAMIQIGGVGLISFVCLFIIMRKQKLNMMNRQIIQSSFNKVELSGTSFFLKRIFKYVAFFEALGALLYAIRFIPQYGVVKGCYYSIFLSISAFCNAGIDPLGSTSLLAYSNDWLVSGITAMLIICGGLGFVVWFEISDLCKKKISLVQMIKKFSVHTKIVLIFSFWLIITGAVEFFIVEYSSMSDLSLSNKILVSLFQSISYRTAGFSTYDFAKLSKTTLIFSCLYMLIGGSVGGTAGGMKVTTFAVIFMKISEYFRGNSKAKVFKKRISEGTISRAYFTLVLYLAAIFVAMCILTMSMNCEVTALFFEAISAIGTVGLSAGLTSSLSWMGKIVIIILMFFGRVGMMAIGAIHMKDLNTNFEYSDSGIIV